MMISFLALKVISFFSGVITLTLVAKLPSKLMLFENVDPRTVTFCFPRTKQELFERIPL